MHILTTAACLLTATSIAAQSPLPPNYKTIFSNSDVLVMHVHYGAHEFVPMHDHPSVSTLYLYLNNSGPIDIIHEDGTVAHRPPTQTGALRIAPGLAERHSVQSNSDTPSDFLRIEFPHVSFTELPEIGKRLAAPAPSFTGSQLEFEDDSLRIVREVCPTDRSCDPSSHLEPNLLVAVTPTSVRIGGKVIRLEVGEVLWSPGNPEEPFTLGPGSQALLVSLSRASTAKR